MSDCKFKFTRSFGNRRHAACDLENPAFDNRFCGKRRKNWRSQQYDRIKQIPFRVFNDLLHHHFRNGNSSFFQSPCDQCSHSTWRYTLALISLCWPSQTLQNTGRTTFTNRRARSCLRHWRYRNSRSMQRQQNFAHERPRLFKNAKIHWSHRSTRLGICFTPRFFA